MRISDWSSDVCSSDLKGPPRVREGAPRGHAGGCEGSPRGRTRVLEGSSRGRARVAQGCPRVPPLGARRIHPAPLPGRPLLHAGLPQRSEEHTSELQTLMRISYAVFVWKKKNKNKTKT